MNALQVSAVNKILIVDDNPQIHSDFGKILLPNSSQTDLGEFERLIFGEDSDQDIESTLDLSLSHAYQGQEALVLVEASMVEGSPFDIAFVDMRMPPGWDGLKTIQELWKVDPELQVVICTAFSDHAWSDVISTPGQTDKLLILKKPFDSSEVYQLASALTKKVRLAKLTASRLNDAKESVEMKTNELRLANEDAERLLQAISSIVIEIDGLGIVSRWNATAERVFSIPSDDALGCNIGELPICWREPDTIAKVTSNRKTTDERPPSREFEFYDSNDSIVVIGLTSYPVVTPNQPDRFLILGIDLTEHKKVEQQLASAHKLEAVGQLAAGVAHEINTPMQYIGDNVSYVKRSFQSILSMLTAYQRIVSGFESGEIKGSIPEEAVLEFRQKKFDLLLQQVLEALDDSEEGIAHVSKIVSAMKQFSHPGEETKTLVNLNDALDSAITVTSNEWKYVADVIKDFDESLPNVEGLHGELNQVFLNLIVNSAHAIAEKNANQNGEKGTITISSRALERHAEIRVADTGSGIPREIEDKIFEPFFTTKALGQGTGQGLAIAHQVITSGYNGEFRFESAPDKGTIFIIKIPFVSSDENVANEKGI